jgi:UDP-N-acetyl-2-amino-2-deoxyglucuronate dehydrogenase
MGEKMNNYSSIVDRKIRIGIICCGRVSKNHFGSIEKHCDEMDIVAICDIDAVVLGAHAEKYKVPAYHDMREMLQKEQLDLVALCTPSGIHPEQTILAARHKIHVMTEKPMTTR